MSTVHTQRIDIERLRGSESDDKLKNLFHCECGAYVLTENCKYEREKNYSVDDGLDANDDFRLAVACASLFLSVSYRLFFSHLSSFSLSLSCRLVCVCHFFICEIWSPVSFVCSAAAVRLHKTHKFRQSAVECVLKNIIEAATSRNVIQQILTTKHYILVFLSPSRASCC